MVNRIRTCSSSSVGGFADMLLVAVFFCFHVTSVAAASAGQNEVTAKLGGDAVLPCRSPRGAAIMLLEWSRAELQDDGYVFFYRNSHSYENYHHPSIRGRVAFRDPSSVKDGDVAVVLRNVSLSDAGTYECRIIISNSSAERGRTELRSAVQLTVTPEDVQQLAVTVEGGGAEGGGADWGRTEQPKVTLHRANGDGDVLGAVVMPVGVGLLLLVIVIVIVIVGFLIYRRRKGASELRPYSLPPDEKEAEKQLM